MSLADQLKALATAVTSSYAVDSVRRKSLIYEDPSKVDVLTCYQQSMFFIFYCAGLTSFKKLCERSSIFIPFTSTLFAQTTCRLEMCNLLAAEKKKLDGEIFKFLCYISPYVKHIDAIVALEWLVYKYDLF